MGCETAEQVDCVRLLDRLQANALGQYQTLKMRARRLFRRLGDVLGFGWAGLEEGQRKQAMTMLNDMLGGSRWITRL